MLHGRQVLKLISNASSIHQANQPLLALLIGLCALCYATKALAEDAPSYDKLNALIQHAQDQKALAAAEAVDASDPGNTNTGSTDTTPTKRKAPTLRDEAFKQLLDKIAPLSPEQIIEMRQYQDKTDQAVATTPTAPPRPVSSTLIIDLSPGMTPPVIRLSAGFVTSLVFVDSTGQPWPIADYSLGNPKHFNIEWDKKTNTLFIQSASTYSSANLAVRLLTLDTPVMLSLVSGQKEVDYRVDLQVQGRGPNALAPIFGDNLPGASPSLLSILDGIPPPNSQELQVSGGQGRAWLSDGRLFLRTQLTVLSPAWNATVSSPDGTRVYEMAKTSLILASQDGKTVKLELKGL
jgi:intracellular multiplication protein IcmK